MFRGLYTALITPFTDNNQIDYPALDKILSQQIEAGVDGLVVLGTTGESPTISDNERTELIKFVIEKAKGKAQIIVGSGANSTDKTIKLSKEAETLGVDGLLVVNPYYNKPTQEGLFQHFKAVAYAVEIPVMLYNIQGRTSVNLETDTLMKLSKIKNIVAVKEASGNISQMMDVISKTDADFTVVSGDDGLTYPLAALGGDGVVSVLANILPKEMKELVSASLEGNYVVAKGMHYKLLPLMNSMFLETNPIAAKTILAMQDVISENFRLPMTKMSDENKNHLKEIWGMSNSDKIINL